MRAVGPAAARLGAGVTVMAVSAIDHAVDCQRRNQAGHGVLIPTSTFDRMEALVRRGKLQPRVRLRILAGDRRGPALNAVGMAPEAQLIFILDRLDHAAGIGHATNIRNRA